MIERSPEAENGVKVVKTKEGNHTTRYIASYRVNNRNNRLVTSRKLRTKPQAARYYDIMTILVDGIDAKTNFNYTVNQLQLLIMRFDYELLPAFN